MTRDDWRSAFDIYVAGRARAITVEQKREMAKRNPILADEDHDVDGVPVDRPEPVRFGVEVPERLAFHRNAGTWRAALAPTGAHPPVRGRSHHG